MEYIFKLYSTKAQKLLSIKTKSSASLSQLFSDLIQC